MKHGFGGVISFGIAADDKAVEHFCAALKVVTFAVSLGHDESLIFPQPSYDERINLYPEKFRKGFIRFSIGLEDPDDISGTSGCRTRESIGESTPTENGARSRRHPA